MGDGEGYRRGCRELLRIFPAAKVRDHADPHGLANKIVKACLLAPDVLDALAPEERLAFSQLSEIERSTFAQEKPHYQKWSRLNFGLLAYREGNLTNAIAELNECIPGQHPFVPDRTAVAQALLAMCYHRLGNVVEARRYLEEAEATMQDILGVRTWASVNDDGVRYLILRREAEEVIFGKAQPRPSAQADREQARPVARESKP